MTERHRQMQFKSPFEIPEMEVWMPRRDRIFVPSNYTSTSRLLKDLDKMYQTAMEQMYKTEMDRIYRERDRAAYARLYEEADCVPGRQQLIAPYRTSEFAAGAWDHPPRNRPDFRDRVMYSRNRVFGQR